MMGDKTKEHPILFNAEMVRALLDGRKAQTRRVVKPQPSRVTGWGCIGSQGFGFIAEDIDGYASILRCPYGLGDHLWVRETFCKQIGAFGESVDYAYRATDGEACGPWRPSIRMPRCASRIQLAVTDVRVERVQDISEEDCVAEGISGNPWHDEMLEPFAEFWDSINRKRGYGWDANPFVWVVEFEVVTGMIRWRGLIQTSHLRSS